MGHLIEANFVVPDSHTPASQGLAHGRNVLRLKRNASDPAPIFGLSRRCQCQRRLHRRLSFRLWFWHTSNAPLYFFLAYADVSTDLGVSYYYMNQPDKALAQFDKSLRIDPKHVKTLLNVGIVRAFGKQDLTGAAAAWEQVVALSPSSPEGQQAKRALDAMKGAHPNLAGGQAPPAS